MLESVFLNTIDLSSCMACVIASIVLGIIISATYRITNKTNERFLVTLATLPLLVQAVIFLVNGNLGTAFAVAGAFSLIRFRSIPGTSKEILFVFWSMTIGLGLGMGYIGYTSLISVVVTVVIIIGTKLTKNVNSKEKKERKLKIIIPENLDYKEVFDDLLEKYTVKSELFKVKTTNMGSMYELNYNIILKSINNEKQFIDEIRCRNGNMLVSIERKEISDELEL